MSASGPGAGGPAGELRFGPVWAPGGFVHGSSAHFDGAADPVVRELLQNSVDAATAAGRPAVVRFEIVEVPLELLPGVETYRAVFEAARDERRRAGGARAAPDEQRTVARIGEMLDRALVPVLFCVDNGCGLDPLRMRAVLAEGDGVKAATDAGAFGLGHYAAFAASDLRYVLYGATYRDTTGCLRRCVSGHAILAPHSDASGTERGRDGYWLRPGASRFPRRGEVDAFPSEVPDVLGERLVGLPDTGSVVAICGFNDFRLDAARSRRGAPRTAVTEIARVAAANFTHAVHRGALTVQVCDRRREESAVVDAAALEALLALSKAQQRASRKGRIRGADAYAAWRTLLVGESVVVDGARLHWRRLSAGDKERAHVVHVYRRGMWITSDARGLRPNQFQDLERFVAVLALDDECPLQRLVRAAEGPQHQEIELGRLSPGQRKQYRAAVAAVEEALREPLAAAPGDEPYAPPGFACLDGGAADGAEALPTRGAETTPPGAGDQGGGDGAGRGAREGDRRGGGGALGPGPGVAPDYRATLRPRTEATVDAQIEYREEPATGERTGVRLRVASGGDPIAERPLRDTYRLLRRIIDGDSGERAEAQDPAGSYELALSARAGLRVVTVTLAAPVRDPQLLQLDLVKRRPARRRRAA